MYKFVSYTPNLTGIRTNARSEWWKTGPQTDEIRTETNTRLGPNAEKFFPSPLLSSYSTIYFSQQPNKGIQEKIIYTHNYTNMRSTKLQKLYTHKKFHYKFQTQNRINTVVYINFTNLKIKQLKHDTYITSEIIRSANAAGRFKEITKK